MKSIRNWVSLTIFSVVANFALLIWIGVKTWGEEANRYRRSYSTQLTNKLHVELESLPSYLLSGSPDEARKICDAHHDLQELVEIHSEQIKTPIDDKESLRFKKDEDAWYTTFAVPMMKTRENVDAGKATLAEMQMTYLQKDPGTWTGTLRSDLEAIEVKLGSQ